ncbi:MAG: HoxN/HupN/NixA family nickel/cobalt transporter [Solirubrobacteraceae bacterium]|jgi:high-affinity nickel-transport protein
MAFVVIALHIGGLTALLAVSHADHLARAGAVTLGVGLTAYVLGLRHAFDADHIAAIDNTTRKLMSEGKRPVSVGFWFSLGHSTIVFGLAALIAFGVRALDAPVARHGSSLHTITGWVGTLVSGGFLYLIAALNVMILVGIVRLIGGIKRGQFDELALEQQLAKRGLMNRLLGRFTRTVARPAQMYPVGLLFGLGFDTATEVALLVLAGGAAGAGLPWYAVICLPVLFAAGMSLMDSLDGLLMSRAYAWAFSAPVRRVFYNLVITGLSVAVAILIGTVELGGLIASKLNLAGSFWSWLENININTLGYAIVAIFLVTWIVSVTLWRFGHVEQRWSQALLDGDRAAQPR